MNDEKTICFRCSIAEVSECGQYLIITVGQSGKDLVYFAHLPKDGKILRKLDLIPIDEDGDASYDVR